MGYNSPLMAKYQAVRGTKDILPADAAFFQMLENTARAVFARFGFSEIRTPTFESLDLFQRSIGETTDVVQKEMYVFEDRGGRKLALRPEGTAGVVRAFIEHHLSQSTPFCKLFYIGPMFRAERPQAGRFREFWQIGGEYFGNPSPYADAELLLMLTHLFTTLGLPEFRLQLNNLGDKESRAAYRAALLAYLQGRLSTLCEDCRQRIAVNPLRALDCKIDGPTMGDAPTVDQSWTPASRAHFEKVQALLAAQGCAFEVNLRLVRGLDYYNGTVFEVTSSVLGAQNALAGGGRYDMLVKEMDGPEMPAIGFALGAERTIDAIRAAAAPEAAKAAAKKVIFIAAQGAGAAKAFELLEQLRIQPGGAFQVEGGFFDKKLGAQLGFADRLGSTHCLIVGDDELQKQEATLRDLKSGAQTRIPFGDLFSRLAAL
jgi:histidyl-tRNA synthetase